MSDPTNPEAPQAHQPSDDPGGESSGRTLRLPWRSASARQAEAAAERISERLSAQLAQQWATVRAERRMPPPAITAGPSNFSRAQVPWGVDLAAAWAWRMLVIVAAGYLVVRVLAHFSVVTIPLGVALLIAAMLAPLSQRLRDLGLPKSLATLLVMIFVLGSLALLLTYVGNQVAAGWTDLADRVVAGLGAIKDWLRDGPLKLNDTQIQQYIAQVQESVTTFTKKGDVVGTVSEGVTTIGHVGAGFFIVLFSVYFYLADGDRIWSWMVRIAPRAAREHVDTSGRVAWVSLKAFVFATVLVALVDAVGVATVAWILGVPFVLAIGVLVFIGAFVPMIGATIAGSVAVLVALVDQGPFTALLMIGGVILVQQIEGHVLQPFLMGRFVSLHPLGVIVAIACGVLVAGIVGALFAVPLAAALNAVVSHLANFTSPGQLPEEALAEDRERLYDADPAEAARESLTEADRAEDASRGDAPPREQDLEANLEEKMDKP